MAQEVNNSGIEYRQATSEDGENVMRLVISSALAVNGKTLHDMPDYEETLAREAELFRSDLKRGVECLVATDGPKLVGTIQYEILKDGRWSGCGSISNFFVDEAYRSQGIGTELFIRVCRGLVTQGVEGIHFFGINNKRSLKFYGRYRPRVLSRQIYPSFGGFKRDTLELFFPDLRVVLQKYETAQSK